MCKDVGVVKRLELESISKDIAELVKQLGREVEGEVKESDLKKIDEKVHKLIASLSEFLYEPVWTGLGFYLAHFGSSVRDAVA